MTLPNKEELNVSKADIQPVINRERAILEHSVQQHPTAKIHDKKTIGSVPFDGGHDSTGFTKGIDPQNLAGTVKFGLELIQQMRNKGNPFTLIEGIIGGGMEGLIQKFTSMLQSGLDVSKIEQAITNLSAKVNNQTKDKKKTPQEIQQLISEANALLIQVKQGIT